MAIPAVVFFAAAAAVVIVVVVWFRPENTFPDALHPTLRTEQVKRERKWSQAEWVSAAVRAIDLAAQWERSIRDPDGLLNESQRASLLRTASEFVRAYHSESADSYVALIESTEWLDWRTSLTQALAVYQYHTGHSWAGESDPSGEQALRALWPVLMLQNGFRWTDIGIHESGALFSVTKAYADTPNNGLAGFSADQSDYWDGVPMHGYAIQFTTTAERFGAVEGSREILPAVLDGRPSATVVFGHVLVQTQSGVSFVWQTRWVWHPTEELWICDEMVDGAGRIVNTIF